MLNQTQLQLYHAKAETEVAQLRAVPQSPRCNFTMPKRKPETEGGSRQVAAGCNFTMPKRKLGTAPKLSIFHRYVATLPCQSGNW